MRRSSRCAQPHGPQLCCVKESCWAGGGKPSSHATRCCFQIADIQDGLRIQQPITCAQARKHTHTHMHGHSDAQARMLHARGRARTRNNKVNCVYQCVAGRTRHARSSHRRSIIDHRPTHPHIFAFNCCRIFDGRRVVVALVCMLASLPHRAQAVRLSQGWIQPVPSLLIIMQWLPLATRSHTARWSWTHSVQWLAWWIAAACRTFAKVWPA